jgi:hypothetical protein
MNETTEGLNEKLLNAELIRALSYEMRIKGHYDLAISIAKALLNLHPDNSFIRMSYALSLSRDSSQQFIPYAFNEMIQILEDHPEVLLNPEGHFGILDIMSQYAYRCGSEKTLFLLRKIAPFSNNSTHFLRIAEILSDYGDIGEEYEEAFKKAIELDSSLVNQSNIITLKALIKNKKSISKKFIINKYPSIEDLKQDVGIIMNKYLLSGYKRGKSINKTTRFFTMGSCFAANLSLSIKKMGLHSTHLGLEEEVNTTFANVDLINAMLQSKNNKDFFDSMSGIVPVDFNLDETLSEIKLADVFIFTLGVATVFFHKQTGETLMSSQIRKNWRVLEYDYEYRMSSVEENVNNLKKVIEFIRNINPSIEIIISVSPVPILASFSSIPAVQTDCISKSIMRIAANEIVNSEKISNISYWPSFELFRWVSSTTNTRFYADNRHVQEEIVNDVVKTFLSA